MFPLLQERRRAAGATSRPALRFERRLHACISHHRPLLVVARYWQLRTGPYSIPIRRQHSAACEEGGQKICSTRLQYQIPIDIIIIVYTTVIVLCLCRIQTLEIGIVAVSARKQKGE